MGIVPVTSSEYDIVFLLTNIGDADRLRGTTFLSADAPHELPSVNIELCLLGGVSTPAIHRATLRNATYRAAVVLSFAAMGFAATPSFKPAQAYPVAAKNRFSFLGT